MLKQDIANVLRKESGCEFITRKEVAAALGYKDPHNINRYLVNLQRLPGKKYYIPDVAAAIMQEVTTR